MSALSLQNRWKGFTRSFRQGAIFLFLALFAARAFAGQASSAWGADTDSRVGGSGAGFGQCGAQWFRCVGACLQWRVQSQASTRIRSGSRCGCDSVDQDQELFGPCRHVALQHQGPRHGLTERVQVLRCASSVQATGSRPTGGTVCCFKTGWLTTMAQSRLLAPLPTVRGGLVRAMQPGRWQQRDHPPRSADRRTWDPVRRASIVTSRSRLDFRFASSA